MLIYSFLLFSFIFVLYICFRFIIFAKTQKDKICRVCNGNSHDTERVARNTFIKKIFLAKDTHKYWCRKCGNNFYYMENSN
jgi:hypothetical protein